MRVLAEIVGLLTRFQLSVKCRRRIQIRVLSPLAFSQPIIHFHRQKLIGLHAFNQMCHILTCSLFLYCHEAIGLGLGYDKPAAAERMSVALGKYGCPSLSILEWAKRHFYKGHWKRAMKSVDALARKNNKIICLFLDISGLTLLGFSSHTVILRFFKTLKSMQ